MATPLIGYRNRAEGATLAGGSWAVTLDNLKDNDVDNTARSTSCKRAHTRARVDLGALFPSLRCLNVRNHTMPQYGLWRARVGRASLDLLFDDEDGDINDTRLTKSGGTNGTRVNKRGRIVRVTRTNSALRSQSPANAAWTKAGVTATDNQAVGASGTTLAKILCSAGSSAHAIYQAVTVTGDVWCSSAELKQGTLTIAGLSFGGGTAVDGAYFNLAAGEVGTTASGTWAVMEPSGGGAYICAIVRVLSAGTSYAQVEACQYDGQGTTWTAAGTEYLYAGELQIEANSDVSPRIVTAGTTVTATESGRIDHSPVNLATGTNTQTISAVPAGKYILSACGADVSVVASGSGLKAGTSKRATNALGTLIEVESACDVTLTVAGTVSELHFRECLGLLVEEERTNSALYSNDWTNGVWIATNVTPTYGVEAPDGTSTATTLSSTATLANIYQAISHTGTAAVSVWVRRRTGTGQVLLKSPGNVNAAMSTLTGAWQRFEVSDACATTGYLGIVFASSGDEVDVWIGQFEKGASFASSSIPTTTAAVTRAQDIVKVNGSNFTALFNKAAGTCYVEANYLPSSLFLQNNRVALGLDNGVGAYRTILYNVNGTNAGIYAIDPGTGLGVIPGTNGSPAGGNFARSAFADSGATDLAHSSEGSLNQFVVSVAPNTDAAQLQIGGTCDTASLGGHIKRVAYFPERLTNAELVTLTTSGPDALGVITGWLDALQFAFVSDTPSDWGASHDLTVTFDAITARYATLEFDARRSTNAWLDLGALFISGAWQPEEDANSAGYADDWIEHSTFVESEGGKEFGTERDGQRLVRFGFPALTETESNELAEMRAYLRRVKDVVFVPDPDDPALSQRWGGRGQLRKLGPIESGWALARSAEFEFKYGL